MILRGGKGRAVACLRTHLGWVWGQGCGPWGFRGPGGSSAGQARAPTGFVVLGFRLARDHDL